MSLYHNSNFYITFSPLLCSYLYSITDEIYYFWIPKTCLVKIINMFKMCENCFVNFVVMVGVFLLWKDLWKFAVSLYQLYSYWWTVFLVFVRTGCFTGSSCCFGLDSIFSFGFVVYGVVCCWWLDGLVILIWAKCFLRCLFLWFAITGWFGHICDKTLYTMTNGKMAGFSEGGVLESNCD